MSTELSGERLDRFAELMYDLISLQVEINNIVSSKTVLISSEKAGLMDKIKEWLKKAQQIAKEVKPREFTVGAEVGFPPRVSVAFTWG